jgi:hypothetical protein
LGSLSGKKNECEVLHTRKLSVAAVIIDVFENPIATLVAERLQRVERERVDLSRITHFEGQVIGPFDGLPAVESTGSGTGNDASVLRMPCKAEGLAGESATLRERERSAMWREPLTGNTGENSESHKPVHETTTDS